MLQAITYLLGLKPGEELASLFAIIDLIDRDLGSTTIRTEDLLSRLQSYNTTDPELRRFDFGLIKAIQTNLVLMLSEAPSTAVTELTSLLNDDSKRELASIFLGWFGQLAQGALPALIGMAGGIHDTRAKQAILRIGGGEQLVLATLQQSLRDDDNEVFGQMCKLLASMERVPLAEFARILESATQHSSPHIREETSDTLVRWPEAARRIPKHVIAQLKTDRDENVRDAAAKLQ